MKKRKSPNTAAANEDKTKPKIKVDDVSDEENEGFGGWLKSSEGVAYMRLFVLVNSLVVFMTMTWPHIVECYEIVYSYFTE